MFNFNLISLDNIIFSTGLRFSIASETGAPFIIINTETGYRNYAGRDSFYFTLSSDNLIPLLLTFWPILFMGL